MAIKLADTLAPMADFPAAMAEHVEFSDGKSLQEKYDLGELGGGGSSLYVVTGSLDIENEENPVTLNQTFEEIKAAYNEGKTIVADILVAGEAQYIFNLLYILEDAIAFEWINSAAKAGGQITLMNDNTVTFTMTSFEGEETTNTIPIIENGKEVVQHKITKNRSITELETYTDRNNNTGYKIDDLYLTYDCEKLAKGFDDWLANKGITPVKGETYEDVAQIQAYSPGGGGYVYFSTHIRFDTTTYLIYEIKYNDTNYIITSVQYDHTNGKTPTAFSGLNVFNIAKIIPELAGCYIQSDILDVLHNWFELYKPIGLEDSVGLYSKKEALLNQDLALNTSIDSKTVGSFDLGNIVSLMTSPLQKLLFSVDSKGENLKAFANDEKNRAASLTNGLFGSNLLAPKNTFATLNDMSTLPTPPDGALGIWTIVPDAPGQPESANKGGTLIIAHITSMLYSQTITYIGTRIAIYVTQGAIYYALGYGGKYYPTASWTPASGGAFRWYKISSTLV